MAQSKSSFLRSVRAFLAGFRPEVLEEVEDAITSHGGTVETSFNPLSTTHAIVTGISKEDDLCKRVTSSGVPLLTDIWLQECIARKRILVPCKPLHFPPVKTSAIPGAELVQICLTGYQGTARAEISLMADLIGASFSKALHGSQTTHLVCYRHEGEKYSVAKRCNIKLVNHLWLEDSFSSWKLQPEDQYSCSGLEAEEQRKWTRQEEERKKEEEKKEGERQEGDVDGGIEGDDFEPGKKFNGRDDCMQGLEKRDGGEGEQKSWGPFAETDACQKENAELEGRKSRKEDEDNVGTGGDACHLDGLLVFNQELTDPGEDEIGQDACQQEEEQIRSFGNYKSHCDLSERKDDAGPDWEDKDAVQWEEIVNDPLFDEMVPSSWQREAGQCSGGARSRRVESDGRTSGEESSKLPTNSGEEREEVDDMENERDDLARLEEAEDKSRRQGLTGVVCEKEEEGRLPSIERAEKNAEVVFMDERGVEDSSLCRTGEKVRGVATAQGQEVEEAVTDDDIAVAKRGGGVTKAGIEEKSQSTLPREEERGEEDNREHRWRKHRDEPAEEEKAKESHAECRPPVESEAGESLQEGGKVVSRLAEVGLMMPKSKGGKRKVKEECAGEKRPAVRNRKRRKQTVEAMMGEEALEGQHERRESYQLGDKDSPTTTVADSRDGAGLKEKETREGEAAVGNRDEVAGSEISATEEAGKQSDMKGGTAGDAKEQIQIASHLDGQRLADECRREEFPRKGKSPASSHQNVVVGEAKRQKRKKQQSGGCGVLVVEDDAEIDEGGDRPRAFEGKRQKLKDISNFVLYTQDAAMAAEKLSGGGKHYVRGQSMRGMVQKPLVEEGNPDLGGWEGWPEEQREEVQGEDEVEREEIEQGVGRMWWLQEEVVSEREEDGGRANVETKGPVSKSKMNQVPLKTFQRRRGREMVEGDEKEERDEDGEEVEQEDKKRWQGDKKGEEEKQEAKEEIKEAKQVDKEKEEEILEENEEALAGKRLGGECSAAPVAKARRGNAAGRAKGSRNGELNSTSSEKENDVSALKLRRGHKKKPRGRAFTGPTATLKGGPATPSRDAAKCFVLGGFSSAHARELQAVIRRLGGRIADVEQHEWKGRATHVVLAEPLKRTEKFFAAAAAGSWLLRPDYISESRRSGCFLPEAPFEWYGQGFTADGNIHLAAPRRWRQQREATGGCGAFHKLRVAIGGEMTSPSALTLKRAIKAGGGVVVSTDFPFPEPNRIDIAVLRSDMTVDSPHVKKLLNAKIGCVTADFFVSLIAKPEEAWDQFVLFSTKEFVDATLTRMEETLLDALSQKGMASEMAMSISFYVKDRAAPSSQASEGDVAEGFVRLGDDVPESNEVHMEDVVSQDVGGGHEEEIQGAKRNKERESIVCEVCKKGDREDELLLCGTEDNIAGCGKGFHLDCLSEPLNSVPLEDWFCPQCSDLEK